MAKADERLPSKLLSPVGGMDESIQSTESDISFDSAAGVFPFFIGSHQRLFGKKLVDVNPEQPVYGIAQSFNGYGQYGYYVQTEHKLYYHLCDSPASFAIDFVLPTQIGVDDNGHSLDIFGRRTDGTTPVSPHISCLFGFPDKPTNFPFDRFGFSTWQEHSSPAAGYTYHGFIVVRSTGGTAPYTETIAAYQKGVDYDQQGSIVDLHDLFTAYAGAQKFRFFHWFRNVGLSQNTYIADGILRSNYLTEDGDTLVPFPSTGITLATGQTINWPAGDAINSGTFSGYMHLVADTATSVGVFSMTQES